MGFIDNYRKDKYEYTTDLKFWIIFKTENGHIDELCVKGFNPSVGSFLIPNVGETFINRITDKEYEVKDVIRSFDKNGEYGVQVMLKERKESKYTW